MEDVKRKRNERENNNQALGIACDVQFQALVEEKREKVPFMQPVSFNLSKYRPIYSTKKLPDYHSKIIYSLLTFVLYLAYISGSTQNLRLHQEKTNLLKRVSFR